jgi:hypothetical protein
MTHALERVQMNTAVRGAKKHLSLQLPRIPLPYKRFFLNTLLSEADFGWPVWRGASLLSAAAIPAP